jgi:cytoskeletal protein RodZ
MAFWNRKNDTTGVPQEVQEYYQTAKRERAGVAWLLAIATLIVTVLLALAIFFAGRWLWRTVTNNDDKSATQTTQTEQREDDKSSADDRNNTGSARPEQPSNDQDRTSQNNDSEAPRSEGDEPAVLPGDRAEPTDESNDLVATTPRTGDAIPETGPGNTLAVFIAVTVLGYLAHRKYLLGRK